MDPYLQLLGPVQLTNTPGPRPEAPARATELVTFLALHPWPSSELLDEALWPDKRVTATTRNPGMNIARSWLGTDTSGHPGVNFVAAGGYSLAAHVKVDWHHFTDLIGPDPVAASTTQLHDALRLVRGQPLSGINPVRYRWAETDRAAMILAITQVANEVTRRAHRAHDRHVVGWATAIGLTVDPVNEFLWRHALVAAARSGVAGRLEDVAAQMASVLKPLGGPEDATTEVLRRLSALPTTATQGRTSRTAG